MRAKETLIVPINVSLMACAMGYCRLAPHGPLHRPPRSKQETATEQTLPYP
jgi:hypothetical protein